MCEDCVLNDCGFDSKRRQGAMWEVTVSEIQIHQQESLKGNIVQAIRGPHLITLTQHKNSNVP